MHSALNNEAWAITENKCSPLQVIPGYSLLSFQIKKKEKKEKKRKKIHAWIVELHFFNSNK